MIPIPNPLLIYAAAGALVIGAIGGYKVRDWQCDAAVAKALEKAERVRREMQDEVDRSARDYEAAKDRADGLRATRATTIERIYKEVPAPAPDCAAPSGVVGLLQGGINSANANTAGKLTDTMPSSK